MVDSRYNTLIIIEGESCEKSFFQKLCNLISIDRNTLVIPFCNDIYELYQKIKEYDFNTTTKDVILNCLELNDEIKNVIKNTKFVNTYLVFDLDLQNDSEDRHIENLEKVKQMLELFTDETGEYGKLFINYPMMESYRHFYFSNPSSLKNKSIISSNEILINYKNIVGQEGTNKNINSYNLNDFYKICKTHLMQANLLLNNKFVKPSKLEYEQIIDIKNLHTKQSENILKQNYMLVLNTSSFIYSEFYPNILNSRN